MKEAKVRHTLIFSRTIEVLMPQGPEESGGPSETKCGARWWRGILVFVLLTVPTHGGFGICFHQKYSSQLLNVKPNILQIELKDLP